MRDGENATGQDGGKEDRGWLACAHHVIDMTYPSTYEAGQSKLFQGYWLDIRSISI